MPVRNEKIDKNHMAMGGFRDNTGKCYPERNKRTVWTINPKPFSEAHFAVYPEELCETPIKAGCPEFVCKKCGKPREKIYESKNPSKEYMEWDKHRKAGAEGSIQSRQCIKSLHRNDGGVYSSAEYKGLTDCNCKAGFTGGIVYDPFFGSGTTGLVAHKLNRKFIGSEISEEYCKIAEKRLGPELKQVRFL